MKINYKEYLKSDYWLGIREQVYERDGHKCKLCDSPKNICVHHLSYENLYNEKLEDLVTLCRKCHYIIHKENPFADYQSYRYYVLLKEKEDKYKKFKETFIHNLDTIVGLYNKIKFNNFMRLSDFEKELNIINKDKCFAWYCLEQFNLILIFGQFDNGKPEWFPKKVSLNNPIIVTQELYRKHKNDLMILMYSYSLELTDISTLFEQTI